MSDKDQPRDLGLTSFRKLAHVEICMHEPVEAHRSAGWEDFHLVHRAVPEMGWEEIDTRVTLFGKTLDLPLISAAMTGGHPEVRTLNENIARLAQKFRFGMGVGSQRAALEKNEPYITESFRIVRDLAPDILVIGNLGGAQFSEKGGYGESEARRAVELVRADVLAIHMNPGQEVVQPEGDNCFRGVMAKAREVAERVAPVILKEVGSGFSREDARRVEDSPLAGIDVGGLGGTSWIGVESLRALKKGDQEHYELGQLFWDWGIPTAVSVVEVRSAMKSKVLIATGGVRNGLQAAKAIALGADAVGMALPLLKASYEGMEALERFVRKFHAELKTAMFLTGCRTIADLKKVPVVSTGTSREWLVQRGIG